MKPQLDWDLSDRWRSNDGKGPLTARVLSVVDGFVKLEHWRSEGGPRTRCEVSEKYFTSKRCGWQKVSPGVPHE